MNAVPLRQRSKSFHLGTVTYSGVARRGGERRPSCGSSVLVARGFAAMAVHSLGDQIRFVPEV
jgi:hypothetical protein